MFHKIPGTKANLYQGKFISYDKEGDEDTRIEGGLQKLLDTRKGGSEKIVGLGGESKTVCILQSRPMTLSYRSDGFQLNNLMTCATQLYHVIYRYNKCSLSNSYTFVHPKNA